MPLVEALNRQDGGASLEGGRSEMIGDKEPTGLPKGSASPYSTAPSSTGRVLITLATYNECENIVGMIDQVHAAVPSADVLVVDDNSPDGTGRIAEQLAASRPWLQVLHRAEKKGLGAALMHALEYALERQYDFWVTMDADFSHPPAVLPRLIAGMNQFDVYIGSRYVQGGGITGWDAKRHFMSRAINTYSRITLGLDARDTSGAFRCYRLSKLRGLDLGRVYSTGYAFMEEFLFHCKQVGCKMGETPFVFENRKAGASKISLMEAIKALWGLLYVGMRYRIFGR